MILMNRWTDEIIYWNIEENHGRLHKAVPCHGRPIIYSDQCASWIRKPLDSSIGEFE
jgi:hypothetical protein